MSSYVAFIRGINVGGNTLVPMKQLAEVCTHTGCRNVRTFLNSGNVLFESQQTEEELRVELGTALREATGKEIGVIVRSTADLERIVGGNPFTGAVPSQVGVLLVAGPVVQEIVREFVIPGREQVVIGEREVYIHYPDGMGRSKLKLPLSLRVGTMRNISTLKKLVRLSRKN